MFSLDILVALALLAIFFWMLGAIMAVWRNSRTMNHPKPITHEVAQYMQHGEFFYHRLSLPVRAVICTASLLPQQCYASNRATITLCYITAFVRSINLTRPGVISNTSADWTRWIQKGLHFAFGANVLQKPLSHLLVACTLNADRSFLVSALQDAIHQKVSAQETDAFEQEED